MSATWVRFESADIRQGCLSISAQTHVGKVVLNFSVPRGFFTHNDCVAAAFAPLCGNKYETIEFNFPVSERCVAAVSNRTQASVSATSIGPERSPGRNYALNYSGGFDSIAAHLLAPEQKRIAVSFGGLFDREADFFRTLDPDVVCDTDFRQKIDVLDDWLFMGAVAILFAEFFDLGRMGFGTIFEASPWHYVDSAYSVAGRFDILDAVGHLYLPRQIGLILIHSAY